MDLILGVLQNIKLQDDLIREAKSRRSFELKRYFNLIGSIYPLSGLVSSLSVSGRGYVGDHWPESLTALIPLSLEKVVNSKDMKPFKYATGEEAHNHFSAHHSTPPKALDFFPLDKHYVIYVTLEHGYSVFEAEPEIAESLIVMVD